MSGLRLFTVNAQAPGGGTHFQYRAIKKDLYVGIHVKHDGNHLKYTKLQITKNQKSF